jgi:DUF4097 and DUF4098 domain-containing protein YvlB
MRRETFRVGERPRIELSLPAGEAAVLPGEPGVVEVEVSGSGVERFLIERRGEKVVVRAPRELGGGWGSWDVTVRTPAGAGLEAKVASADLRVEVELGSLGVVAASGDVRAGDVTGDAAVKSASGEVRLGSVGGGLSVTTASGDVRAGSVSGPAAFNTASGEVRVASALEDFAVRTASGDVDLQRYAGESLQCNTISGDVRVGFPPGRVLDVDINTLSGEIRSDFPPEEDGGSAVRLRVKTVSGDVELVRAGGP